MKTLRKGLESGGGEMQDLDHKEDLSDFSKDTTQEGGKVGAEFSSPGCWVLVLTNEWVFPEAGLNPQVSAPRLSG